MPERIPLRRVAEITGLSLATLQRMAKAGDLPSAAQLGRCWTCREDAIRLWIRDREHAACRKSPTPVIFTGEAGHGGSATDMYDAAYRRLISDSRGKRATGRSSGSTARP